MKIKLLILIWMVCCCSSVFAVDESKLTPYVYEDTKQLVILVEDAAFLLAKKGEAAFNDFGVKNSKWFNDEHYIFVYDLTGKCLFHPIEPGLVGEDLSSFKDTEQRPVIGLITDVGKKSAVDASDWVFYLWEMPGHYAPYWKTSYIRKAITPDGKIYVVGSGLYNMKIEKVFIQERVDMAVDLILQAGKAASFDEIKKSSSIFHILGSYVFVIDKDGNVVVDPSFPSALQRNVANLRDSTGKVVMEEIKKHLQTTDRFWYTFMWPQYDSNIPTQMMLYLRKVQIGGETFFVYASFYPVKPIWMLI